MSAASSPVALAGTRPPTPAWRRPWLGGDGLRGLGALLVFFAHVVTAESTYAALGWTGMPGRDIGALFGGEVGWHAVISPARLVNLFFAFSAYLLARPFIAWALGRTQRPSAKNFYIRRVMRLMPAFWAVCALVVLWLVVLKGGAADVGRSLQTVFLVNGGLSRAGELYSWAGPMAPTWTVRVEALGYVLLPAVAVLWWWTTRRWGFRGLLIGLGVVGAVAITVRFVGAQTNDGPGPLQWLFIPGLVVAAVEAHDPTREWITRRRRGPTLLLTFLAFLLLIGSEPAGVAISQHLAAQLDTTGMTPAEGLAAVQAPLRWANAVSIPLQLVGATGLLLGIIAVEWQGGRPPLGLDSRLARWFGERSYSFYLVHFGVLGALLPHVGAGDRGVGGLLLLGVAALVVSMTITTVLFRVVERPTIALGVRWTKRPPPTRHGVVPTGHPGPGDKTPRPAAAAFPGPGEAPAYGENTR